MDLIARILAEVEKFPANGKQVNAKAGPDDVRIIASA
jgi:hypothetical protein